MSSDRFIYGEGSAKEALRVIYRELRDLNDFHSSIAMSTIAAATKFDQTPRQLITQILEQVPSDEEWEAVSFELLAVANDTNLEDFNGHFH